MTNAWCAGWMAAVIGLAGCGDSATSSERPPPPKVAVRTEPASAGECPYGGSAVSSGLDDNGNGVLDPGEVHTRTVLCSDPPVQPPPTIVVRLVAEPAGAHCALGGTAVQSGPDRNASGRLDDDEIAHIDYVCGEVLLTRLAAEPEGPRCVAGGVAFLVGRDRNHDGELGGDEVEQTELECGSVLSRDVAVATEADAAALAKITIIAGSLAIDGAAAAELALPRLVQIRGALEVRNDDALTHLGLPALQAVDGGLTLALDRQLAAIDLPQLHRAGSLTIDRLPALHDLGGLSGLTTVVGDVRISGNDALISADVPVSRIGGGLSIDGNAQLVRTSWAVADRLVSLRVAANPQLQSVDLAGAPGGVLSTLGDVTIASNDRLGRVAVAADRIAALRIEANPALSEVAVSAFQIGGDVELRGNGPLSLTISTFSDFEFEIGGALALSGPVAALASSAPLTVVGDCTLDATRLTSLGVPNRVMQCGGALRLIDNPQLAAISLIAIGGGLEVRNNAALATLGSLVQNQIDGDLTIADNAVLRTAPSLEALIRVRGDVRIAGNPALKAAFSPALERVDGDLSIDGNPGLDVLGLTRLAHVRSLAVTGSAAVTDLDLLALSDVTLGLDIRGNAALRHIQLPVLRRADLGVFDNPQLPACEVAAVFAAIAGEHHQSGNDEIAVCGPRLRAAREGAR